MQKVFYPQNSFSKSTYADDYNNFRAGAGFYPVNPPRGMSDAKFESLVVQHAENYHAAYYGIIFNNSNTAAATPIYQSGGRIPFVISAPGLFNTPSGKGMSSCFSSGSCVGF